MATASWETRITSFKDEVYREKLRQAILAKTDINTPRSLDWIRHNIFDNEVSKETIRLDMISVGVDTSRRTRVVRISQRPGRFNAPRMNIRWRGLLRFVVKELGIEGSDFAVNDEFKSYVRKLFTHETEGKPYFQVSLKELLDRYYFDNLMVTTSQLVSIQVAWRRLIKLMTKEDIERIIGG